MTPLRNLRCQREDRSSGSMTRALVEDSTGRLFGGQSTSHYSSDHRENRKHVLPDGGSGRVVGYLGWSAVAGWHRRRSTRYFAP